MKHHVRTPHRPCHRIVIANVDAVQLDPRPHFFQVLLRTRQKIVDHAHLAIAPRQQRAHQARTDEAAPRP